jgi:hypothetical protein
MLPLPAPIRRPTEPVDDALEAAAARALEFSRGKAAYRGAPPQAGAIANRVLKPILPARLSLSLHELRLRWREIVGEKLAPMTEPEKIAGGAAGRALTVVASGPAAPFVQHQIPLILERCNLAGADIKSVQIKQGVVRRPSMVNVRPFAAPLSADQERALDASLSGIDSPGLRAALAKLGRAVAR